MLGEPYWAEAHPVPRPSGTRAVFASPPPDDEVPLKQQWGSYGYVDGGR